jgi:hypothetical protein
MTEWSNAGNGAAADGSPPAGRAGESGPSFVQRVLWLFSSPGSAFQAPRNSTLWIAPLIVAGLMVVTESVLLKDISIAEMKSRIEQNEKIPDAQKEQILTSMDHGPGAAGGAVAQGVMAMIFGLLTFYGIPALLYLLGFNFGLGGKVSFRDILTVTLFTGLIYVPRELLRVPLMLSRGTMHVYTSPAAFLGGGGGVATQILNQFDVFDLYRLFLLIVGFGVVTGFPPRKAAFPVAAVWATYFLIGLGCRLSPLGQYMP